MEAIGESMATLASVDLMIKKPMLLEFVKQYLDGGDPKMSLVSALYADYRGLSPLLIQLGGPENLLDDTRRMIPRLKEAGVAAEVEVWKDMVHVWQLFAHVLDKGQEAIDISGSYILARIK
jgi:epsilon-lactone hydrolase